MKNKVKEIIKIKLANKDESILEIEIGPTAKEFDSEIQRILGKK